MINNEPVRKSITEVLTRSVVSVTPETPLSQALAIMQERRISCLVITKDGTPEGIYTERDLVWAVNRGLSDATPPIKNFMTENVITAGLDIDIYDAFNIFEAHRIRHLVIIDDGGAVAGVISQHDIMKHLGIEHFVEVKTVAKIMTANVMRIRRGMKVSDAVDRMTEGSLSCIIVEDDEGRPIGILTERDVVSLFLDKRSISMLKIEDVMNSPVITVPVNAPVHEAAQTMRDHKLRRVVVVDESGCIAGLITQYDFIKGMIEERYAIFLTEIIRKKEGRLKNQSDSLTDSQILAGILNSLHDTAIIALDGSMHVKSFNTGAEKLFGKSGDAVTGKHAINIHHMMTEDRLRGTSLAITDAIQMSISHVEGNGIILTARAGQ